MLLGTVKGCGQEEVSAVRRRPCREGRALRNQEGRGWVSGDEEEGPVWGSGREFVRGGHGCVCAHVCAHGGGDMGPRSPL